MKLEQYLRLNNLPVAIFARKHGISIYTLKKWLRGERIPRTEAMAQIMKITGGKVDANDWLPDDA